MAVQVLTIVYDRVAEATVGPVITTPTVGVSVRMFQDVVRDERSAMALHPADYDLMQIGEIDGMVLYPSVPRVLVNAADLLPDAQQLALPDIASLSA